MKNFILSLDISTTNIGFALWDDRGKLVELKHLELKLSKDVPVDDRDIFKAEIFKKYLTDFKIRLDKEFNGELSHVIVEAPLGGSNNANTVSLLYGFNGICRYILFHIFDVLPIKITVHESRKLFCPELVSVRYTKKGEKKETLSFPEKYKNDKKAYIWEKVSKLEPQIEWFYNKEGKLKDTNFDMADSYCVGHSGLKKIGIL